MDTQSSQNGSDDKVCWLLSAKFLEACRCKILTCLRRLRSLHSIWFRVVMSAQLKPPHYCGVGELYNSNHRRLITILYVILETILVSVETLSIRNIVRNESRMQLHAFLPRFLCHIRCISIDRQIKRMQLIVYISLSVLILLSSFRVFCLLNNNHSVYLHRQIYRAYVAHSLHIVVGFYPVVVFSRLLFIE